MTGRVEYSVHKFASYKREWDKREVKIAMLKLYSASQGPG